jgi:hypothetical protein
VVQVVCIRHVTQLQSQASPCGIYCGKSDIKRRFPPASISVFPSQYHCTNAAYS